MYNTKRTRYCFIHLTNHTYQVNFVYILTHSNLISKCNRKPIDHCYATARSMSGVNIIMANLNLYINVMFCNNSFVIVLLYCLLIPIVVPACAKLQ